MTQSNKKLVTRLEAQEILNCSRPTIDNLVREKRLHPVMLDSKIRFSREEIATFIRVECGLKWLDGKSEQEARKLNLDEEYE